MKQLFAPQIARCKVKNKLSSVRHRVANIIKPTGTFTNLAKNEEQMISLQSCKYRQKNEADYKVKVIEKVLIKPQEQTMDLESQDAEDKYFGFDFQTVYKCPVCQEKNETLIKNLRGAYICENCEEKINKAVEEADAYYRAIFYAATNSQSVQDLNNFHKKPQEGKVIGFQPVKTIFGYAINSITNPRGEYEDKSIKPPSSFCLFFSLENNADLTEKYVESVVWHLDPIVQPRSITTKFHPFLCSRSYNGKSIAVMKVNFKAWTELEPVRIEFMVDDSQQFKTHVKEFSPMNMFNSRHKTFQDHESAKMLQEVLQTFKAEQEDNMVKLDKTITVIDIINVAINTQWIKMVKVENSVDDDQVEQEELDVPKKSKKCQKKMSTNDEQLNFIQNYDLLHEIVGSMNMKYLGTEQEVSPEDAVITKTIQAIQNEMVPLMRQLDQGEKPAVYFFNTAKYELEKLRKLVKVQIENRKEAEVRQRKKILKLIDKQKKREKKDTARRTKQLKNKVKAMVRIIKAEGKRKDQSVPPKREVVDDIHQLIDAVDSHEEYCDWRQYQRTETLKAIDKLRQGTGIQVFDLEEHLGSLEDLRKTKQGLQAQWDDVSAKGILITKSGNSNYDLEGN